MDQGVVIDHDPGMLLPFIGTVGQVIDIQTYMVRGEILHQNIARELDKYSQHITVGIQELRIQASHLTIEQEDIPCMAQKFLLHRFEFHGNLQEEF